MKKTLPGNAKGCKNEWKIWTLKAGCSKCMKYKFLCLIASWMGRLSPAALRRLARAMAFVTWHCLPSRREVAIAALQKHLHLSRNEATRLARKSFEENFVSFLEIFHADRFSIETSVSHEIFPEVRAELEAETAPLVIVTAHMGSWEMMPGLAADSVPHRHRMVIVRKHNDPDINRLMAALRGIRGMQVVDHRQASDTVLPKLRENGLAAFLVDHNCNRREAVFLPFLEDTAAVNMGPAMLALRAKAVVYPAFLVRDGEGKHLLYVYPPLRTADLTGSIAERVKVVAQFYTDAVADVVKKHPEQWFWMHKRWKTREKIKK